MPQRNFVSKEPRGGYTPLGGRKEPTPRVLEFTADELREHAATFLLRSILDQDTQIFPACNTTVYIGHHARTEYGIARDVLLDFIKSLELETN